MDAFIYLPPKLGISRDVIEDELEESLGELGEVTGGGSGLKGSNLDLLIEDGISLDQVLKIIRSTLRRVGVVQARIVIDRKEYPFAASEK